MKWKPISTLRDEKSIIIARIIDGRIDRMTWVDGGLYHPESMWSHWCEQPEILHPAESWPVDAKVLVGSLSNSARYKRHFKEYRDGLFYVFSDGLSSWTSPLRYDYFPYARLAEDGE